ncbi:hypothetical protein F2Q69_00032474 [Brassica cretica]|uniref:Secreted protein n=1 Tax=Brassica cretica TaxID=69181 RepID=A0A8S9RZR7_BRACR|nr:hypothetical protein F2Q69_00032474 [Brassica cretica]
MWLLPHPFSVVAPIMSALLELQARVVVHSSRSSRVSTAGGSWEASFSLTQFAKLFGGGINHLEHRCGEANITKAWSHGSSKVSSLFGNALQWSALLELQARVVVHSSRSSRVSTAGGSWEASFSLTQFAKLFGGGINHLEHRCGEANITKAWSHGSSKVSSLFGNALQWSSYGFCSVCSIRIIICFIVP